MSIVPKPIELEQRIARLEESNRAIVEAVSVLLRRTTAIQAQLDHLAAKLNRP